MNSPVVISGGIGAIGIRAAADARLPQDKVAETRREFDISPTRRNRLHTNTFR